jgi:hypothetical protein
VTAPNSTLMDSVAKIRMTLTQPRKVVEAEREAGGGFDLSLEVTVDGGNSALLLEGFDENERLIAYGSSPPFAVNPTDASLSIYLAPPLSMGEAPARLTLGRSEIGVATLPYGAVFVGGRDNGNTPRAELEIYNAYNHSLVRGLDLPAARAGAAVGTVVDGRTFIVGGKNADGTVASGGWQFNTTVPPSGAYADILSTAAAREAQRMVPISTGRFLITGSAPAELDAVVNTVTPLDLGTPTLPAEMVTVVAGAEIIAIGAGAQVVRYRGGVFDQLSIPQALRNRHAVVATADGQVAVIGGALGTELTADVVKIDPVSGAGTVLPGVLSTPRTRAAVARAGSYIVVAGGVSGDGEVLGDAELLDATTLANVGIIPLVGPRLGSEAVSLPNGQVLLVGGIAGNGLPTPILELFTGEPP